jgi:hypothetical protein
MVPLRGEEVEKGEVGERGLENVFASFNVRNKGKGHFQSNMGGHH